MLLGVDDNARRIDQSLLGWQCQQPVRHRIGADHRGQDASRRCDEVELSSSRKLDSDRYRTGTYTDRLGHPSRNRRQDADDSRRNDEPRRRIAGSLPRRRSPRRGDDDAVSGACLGHGENARRSRHPRRRRQDRSDLRAIGQRAAPNKRVVGVARFSEAGLREKLTGWGIECVAADLLDRAQIAEFAEAADVVFMAGRKFGSSGAEELTWAMNSHVPALVAEAYAKSRIVAYSSGCVYPYVDVTQGRRRPRRHRPFRHPASTPTPASPARRCSSISPARLARLGG